MGIIVWGLDAAGAKASLELAGHTLAPGVWAQVLTIAEGARAAMMGEADHG